MPNSGCGRYSPTRTNVGEGHSKSEEAQRIHFGSLDGFRFEIIVATSSIWGRRFLPRGLANSPVSHEALHRYPALLTALLSTAYHFWPDDARHWHQGAETPAHSTPVSRRAVTLSSNVHCTCSP